MHYSEYGLGGGMSMDGATPALTAEQVRGRVSSWCLTMPRLCSSVSMANGKGILPLSFGCGC